MNSVRFVIRSSINRNEARKSFLRLNYKNDPIGTLEALQKSVPDPTVFAPIKRLALNRLGEVEYLARQMVDEIYAQCPRDTRKSISTKVTTIAKRLVHEANRPGFHLLSEGRIVRGFHW